MCTSFLFQWTKSQSKFCIRAASQVLKRKQSPSELQWLESRPFHCREIRESANNVLPNCSLVSNRNISLLTVPKYLCLYAGCYSVTRMATMYYQNNISCYSPGPLARDECYRWFLINLLMTLWSGDGNAPAGHPHPILICLLAMY